MADWEKHKILPKESKPHSQCGTQISGTYNRLGNFAVEDYVPKWDDEAFKTKSNTTMLAYVHLKQEELKHLIASNPTKVGQKKPKNSRN